MEPIRRRDFLEITGAGVLSSAISSLARAANPSAQTPLAADTLASLPDLLKSARKVASAANGTAEDYFWQDRHTLLFVRPAPDTTGIFRIVSVDTATGRESVPEAFNKQNLALLKGKKFGIGSGDQWEYGYHPPRITLSPDGKWLLWLTAVGDPDLKWVCADLAGKQTIYKQSNDPTGDLQGMGNQAYWLRDGAGWVELVMKYTRKQPNYTFSRANLYRPGVPQPVKTLTIEEMGDGLPVGLLPDNRYILFHAPRDRAALTEVMFETIHLHDAVVKPEKKTISIPPTLWVGDLTLSPDGRRLAWLLVRTVEQKEVHVIYVSHNDGTQMRAVGTMPTVVRVPSRNLSYPSKLRWLPDSSRLSFVYDQAIHVVNV